MTPAFFEAMKWTALAIVSVTVMVCLLECRKEMQERRAKEKFDSQLRIQDRQWTERQEFAKTLDCYLGQINDLKLDIYILKQDNERLQRKIARQEKLMTGQLIVNVRGH